RSSGKWDAAKFDDLRVDPDSARIIAREELANLKQWLEKRWEAKPRDTRLLLSIVKHLPGGEQLTRWSEAAPYLLAIIVATHHAFFGHVDLMILGGWGLATWLTERLSNEVAAQTRATNRRIEERFARLAHDQIERFAQWLDRQAAEAQVIRKLETVIGNLSDASGS